MTILLTGGAGYIGSHLCVQLLNKGYDIVVVDNYANSSPVALQRAQKITGRTFAIYNFDLRNREKLAEVFSNHPIDAVIHLAGFKSVSESTIFPLKYFSNNIISTIVLCEIMQKFGVKKLVFSSSASVYAQLGQHEPISEQHPLGASNPYGQTKQISEQILGRIYEANPSWSISVLRYFNPIGAHVSGLIGEDPLGVPNNLVPYIANVAAGKLPVLYIYGNDYPTKDGTGIRDYIHVEDLAEGHLRALERVTKTRGLDVFNLGTGSGYSVMEVVAAFRKVTGRKIPYVHVPRRKGDTAVCFADVTKARDVLGWEANKGIERMCQDVWRWQQANPNGYEKGIPDEKEVMIHDW